ncbi:helix-turn-helix domain-containing protein [Williamsia deligens]|uniref:Helix-turn-helix domain-containing protein n=1 Tax=Williamsia deligens TaxID=321325 RepID=A0ABW3GAD5_9NOCA|nr:helix-turn-helix transcriptional regulator [Williamsia deligens]
MTTARTGRASAVEIQGFACRVIREARGRKTAELADALGVDRSYITKIETGHSRRVSAEFYSALLAQLQIVDYRALLANPNATATAEQVPA